VVIHDLDHVTGKVFEVWIPGDQAPWRVQIRKRSGEVMFDWNSGRSESRSDFESSQAAAVAAREIEAGTWVLEPWTWGPRMLIRIRDGVRTFVGNDDGTAGLRFEAQQGDLVEVLATRLGTRVIVTLEADGAVRLPVAGSPAQADRVSQTSSPIPAVGKVDAPLAVSPRVGTIDDSAPGITVATVLDEAGSSYRLLRRDEPVGRQSWRLEYLAAGEQRIAVRELSSSAAVLWRTPGRMDSRAGSLPSSGWVLACGTSIWVVRDGYSLDFDRASPALNDSSHFQRSINAAEGEAVLVTAARCAAGGGLSIAGYSLPVHAGSPAATFARAEALAFVQDISVAGVTTGFSSKPAILEFAQLCAAPVSASRRDFCAGLQALRGQ